MQRTQKEIRSIRQRRRALRRLKELHLDLMATLCGEAKEEIDVWAHYKELKTMREEFGTRIHFREALIAALVLCRIHPKSAHTELSHLQRQCTKRDDQPRFTDFAAAVDAKLYPDVLTHHSYAGPTFAGVDSDQVWHAIRDVMAWLKDKGFDSFLNSGTLLGVTRDGDLIDHDDDVDLAVIMNGRTMKTVLRDWVELTRMLREDDLLDDKPSLPEILKLKTGTGFTFDLFPAWSIGKKFYVYPHTPGTLATEDVLPLKVGRTHRVAVPRKPTAMLTQNYGETWKVPDRFFTFPWRQANREFADFLTAGKEAQGQSEAEPLARAA